MQAPSFGQRARNWSMTWRQTLCRGSAVGLEEDLADSGGNDSVLALGHVGQGIAHEVDAATLPGGAEHRVGSPP
jgi:hypothetical protein